MSEFPSNEFKAMRQLRLDCAYELSEAVKDGEAKPSEPYPFGDSLPQITYVNPNGLEIVQTGDLLEVSADFESYNNGRTVEFGWLVEYPEDMRDWPIVFKTILDGRR